MNGLVIFLAGVVIGTLTEETPKWVKTVIWVLLVVIGCIMGALGQFHTGNA